MARVRWVCAICRGRLRRSDLPMYKTFIVHTFVWNAPEFLQLRLYIIGKTTPSIKNTQLFRCILYKYRDFMISTYISIHTEWKYICNWIFDVINLNLSFQQNCTGINQESKCLHSSPTITGTTTIPITIVAVRPNISMTVANILDSSFITRHYCLCNEHFGHFWYRRTSDLSSLINMFCRSAPFGETTTTRGLFSCITVQAGGNPD